MLRKGFCYKQLRNEKQALAAFDSTEKLLADSGVDQEKIKEVKTMISEAKLDVQVAPVSGGKQDCFNVSDLMENPSINIPAFRFVKYLLLFLIF